MIGDIFQNPSLSVTCSTAFVADQLRYQEPPIDFPTLLKKIWDYDKWDEVQKALGLSG